MASQNRAAWLQAKQSHPFTISPAPMPAPSPTNLTIRVAAVAINPVDSAVQTMGLLLPESSYPAILGVDAAGTVTAVGADVKGFEVGDRVCGCAPFNPENWRGTFQLYAEIDGGMVGKVPKGVALEEACVLPLGMNTAAYGLFEKSTLGLALPKAEGKGEGGGKVVVVWGGASSVGSGAIQAAKAAGYAVATTAGEKNLGYCKGIGADWAFDYKKESVVDDIVEALKGKECMGAFNAIMHPDTYEKCAEIVHQLGGVQVVASIVPTVMPFNRDLPHGVKFADNNSNEIGKSEVGPAIYRDWLPAALANGSLKCKPDPVIVGHGLEYCQEACDRIKAGASAQKFVVTLE